MRKIFIITLILYSFNTFGQYKIEYDYVNELEDSFGKSKTANKCYLYTNNIQSKFIKDRVIEGKYETAENYYSSDLQKKIDSENSNVYGDSIGYVITKYLTKDSLQTRSYPGILIKEKMSNTYSITDEYKKIGDLNCQKAVTEIYGRKFEVWFCIDIPINDGPWKLYGLPGLIIEAHSDNRYHNFYARHITKIKNTDYIYKKVPFTKEIDIKVSVETAYKEMEKNFKYQNSKKHNAALKMSLDDLDFPLFVFE